MLRFLLLLVLIAAGAVGYLYHDYQSYLDTPITLTEKQRGFIIERGWSAKRVSAQLQRDGVLEKPHWFDLYVRLSKQSSAIKSGEFALPESITVPELFDVFVRGQTIQYSHSIIEGSTFKQMRALLPTVAQLEHSVADMSDAEIMASIGSPGLHPEGQFFADTYRFPANTTDLDYLKRAHAMLKRVLDEEWQARAPDLPLKTPYEALILASIVEKETAVPAERPLIAGVFLSRINKRMRLQTDPTVIYGMGDAFDGNIRRKDLRTDTPYNTYTRAGLPPTPIAMVGREAIHAVLHPEATSKLYFVSKGDGTHYFSETNEEHNEAVRKYQLRRRNKP